MFVPTRLWFSLLRSSSSSSSSASSSSSSHIHSQHTRFGCMINSPAYQYHVLLSPVVLPGPSIPLSPPAKMAKGKSPAADHAQQKVQESSLEAASRHSAGFDDIEKRLPKRWAVSEMGFLDKFTGHLGRRNPFLQASIAGQEQDHDLRQRRLSTHPSVSSRSSALAGGIPSPPSSMEDARTWARSSAASQI